MGKKNIEKFDQANIEKIKELTCYSYNSDFEENIVDRQLGVHGNYFTARYIIHHFVSREDNPVFYIADAHAPMDLEWVDVKLMEINIKEMDIIRKYVVDLNKTIEPMSREVIDITSILSSK